MNKEPLYDEYIAPLMAQIIAICKREGIPMAATFQLTDDEDAPLYCSSSIPSEWSSDWLRRFQSELARQAGA